MSKARQLNQGKYFYKNSKRIIIILACEKLQNYCYHNIYRIHTDTERSTSLDSDSESPVKQPRLSAETYIGVFADRLSDKKPTDHDKYQLIVNHFIQHTNF